MLLLKRIKGAFMGMSAHPGCHGLLTDPMLDAFADPTFNTEVIKPMQLENLLDQEVQTLVPPNLLCLSFADVVRALRLRSVCLEENCSELPLSWHWVCLQTST